MKILKRELLQNRSVPKGYGLAYYQPDRLIAVCYPIPLNLIVRALRDFYWWIFAGCWRSKYEREILKAERFGYERGREDAEKHFKREK